MKKRYLAVMIACAIGTSTMAAAAGTGSGYIGGVNVEGGSGKFSASNGHPNAPGCATTGRWAVDVTTPQGQAMWSTILLAYSMNKTMNIGGTGQCSVWADSETVAWVQVN